MNEEYDDVDREAEDEAPHHVPLRQVLSGSFNMSRASIPFFVSTMTLEEAAGELRLVENLPADLRSKWRLEELFQREIDWKRVEESLVGYLRSPGKLQFFNALTVALLPTTEERHLEKEYGPPQLAPPLRKGLSEQPWVENRIGSVRLVRHPSRTLAHLSWDPKRVFPATIDGQHRLAALQMLHNAGNLTAQQMKTSISVIFLVLDERAGFRMDGQAKADENLILTVVRELFIDLNRGAENVPRSRSILLDDQEMESRCVRLLIAQRVGERTTDRIPLGLVHWQHAVTGKFNGSVATAPFITTSEVLYLAVKGILRIERPEDPFDVDQVRKYVNSLEDSLGVSEVLAAAPPGRYQAATPLMKHVDLHYIRGDEMERPFANLPVSYRQVADDAFAARWRPLVVRVLLEFKPYADFIKEVDARGGIEGDLAFYLSLPAKAQVQQRKDWGEKTASILDKPLEELAAMKLTQWPFYAVFQKALLRATALAWVQHEVIGPAGATVDEFIDAWLSFLNRLAELGYFVVRTTAPKSNFLLWSGIALNPGSKTVKWNEATAERIAALLYVWWVFHVQEYRRVGPFLASVEKGGAAKFPAVKKAVENVRKGILSAVRAGVAEGTDEAEIEKEVETRLKLTIELAMKPGGDSTSAQVAG